MLIYYDMAKQSYNLHLKGYVGDWDFDADYVDYVLAKNADSEVNVLIDSLGGSLATALSIVAAFRNHGNVNVHFVGMNASAATLASLGAKHISIDSSAMYLVHKCSMEFFHWASANSDKLQDIIKEAKKMKADLDKMDLNAAQMYAAKCKRKPEDLLALMKKGEWLTAKEALEWGFVDEITDFEDDAAPVIDDMLASVMCAHDIPVPSHLIHQQPSAVQRFMDLLSNFFKSNSKMDNTNTATANVSQQEQENNVQQQDTKKPEMQLTDDKDALIKAKDEEIANLIAQVEKLKKMPGEDTSHVVEDKKSTEKNKSDIEDFFDTHSRAKNLYNLVARK